MKSLSPSDAPQGIDLEAGETIRWKKKANRWQGSVRTVGGHLYLTNRRLIFRPHFLDVAMRGEPWSAELGDLQDASFYGLLRWIDISYREGGIERFVVWPPKKTLIALNSAIREAAGTG